jgi:hypothetical protein
MYSLLVPNRKTFSDYVETDVTDGQRLINILVRIQPTLRFISCHPCSIIRPACTRYSRFTTQSPCSVADRRTRISICFTTRLTSPPYRQSDQGQSRGNFPTSC